MRLPHEQRGTGLEAQHKAVNVVTALIQIYLQIFSKVPISRGPALEKTISYCGSQKAKHEKLL